MHMAFYKGPASGLRQTVTHNGIILWDGPYSHCEILIDGWCYSSSSRDGGVRKKQIDVYSGKWDLLDINFNPQYALDAFSATEGLEYDWYGVFRHALPILPEIETKWYCSEWCAYALGLHIRFLTPSGLYRYLLANAEIGPPPVPPINDDL